MLTNCLAGCVHLTYNRFWDRARYWSKIVNFYIENRHFSYPLAFDALVRGVPVGISAPPLVQKKENGVATRCWKNFEDMFIRFDVIQKRDRRADRRTDAARQQRPHLCIASRGKNSSSGYQKLLFQIMNSEHLFWMLKTVISDIWIGYFWYTKFLFQSINQSDILNNTSSYILYQYYWYPIYYSDITDSFLISTVIILDNLKTNK